MTIDELKKKKSEILKLADVYGVKSIKIFGSVARHQSSAKSDIDFLIEMDDNKTILDRIGFKLRLEDLLNSSVDVVLLNSLKKEIRDTLEQEALMI